MMLITIILTTLNSERLLARSIESCLAQTHSDFELLVVDGGSTDRTLEIVNSYNDPRIQIIHQPGNSGKLPGALNLGMAHAKGDFITWTQDDCWYEPDAIERMIEFLETNSEIALVYCDYWLIDLYQRQMLYREVSDPERILYGDVIQQCFLFHRVVYETIGPQDVQYYSVHEVPWRIKVAKQFRIAPLHEPLQYYTLHPDSLTGQFGGYNEQRKIARAIYAEGHISENDCTRRLAAIDVNEAYETFVRKGDYRAFRKGWMAGIRKDKSWAWNIGIWKMWIISWLPQRKSYREKLYHHWQDASDQQQAKLLKKYGLSVPAIPSDV